MTTGLEILIILLLIVLNGLFSLSELALVSVRRARLAVLERKGVKGAAAARALVGRSAALPAHRAGRDHPHQRAHRRVRRRPASRLICNPGWRPSPESVGSPKASPSPWWSSSPLT